MENLDTDNEEKQEEILRAIHLSVEQEGSRIEIDRLILRGLLPAAGHAGDGVRNFKEKTVVMLGKPSCHQEACRRKTMKIWMLK